VPNVFRAGSRIRCAADAYDPDGDRLVVGWELRRDVSDDPRVGGDYEESVPPIEGAVLRQHGKQAEIRLPEQTGKYRIFFYAWDRKGSAGTVNLPVLVKE
jgi:hypothetical protein